MTWPPRRCRHSATPPPAARLVACTAAGVLAGALAAALLLSALALL